MSDSELDSRPTTPLPEAGNDSEDPNRPVSEDRDTPPAPAANPDLDLDDANNDGDLSDNESELSEVDEAEFAEFDPTTVALEDRPQIGIDEDIARTLKAGKRKRAEKGGDKKPKEAKRDKKKRARKDDDEDPDGEELDGKRIRKTKKVDGERKDRDRVKERRAPTPENEENLTPEERRRRALDRAMDAALKNPNKRRRKKDEVVCAVNGMANLETDSSRILKKLLMMRLRR